METQFKGERYTTLVKMREVSNILTGEKVKYPTTYGVYDNTAECEVVIPNFKPLCYEDVVTKAKELNKQEISSLVKEEDIEKIRQIISRTDISDSQKTDYLVNFVSEREQTLHIDNTINKRKLLIDFCGTKQVKEIQEDKITVTEGVDIYLKSSDKYCKLCINDYDDKQMCTFCKDGSHQTLCQ